MTACIRLLDQMPRSIEMELNEIGQCMISGNSGPREHEPVSAIRSKAENISSFRVLPPVTQSLEGRAKAALSLPRVLSYRVQQVERVADFVVELLTNLDNHHTVW